MFESTAATAGREDIDTFTRELLDMNNLKSEFSDSRELKQKKF